MILSSVSSTENYPVHEGSFTLFAVFQSCSLWTILFLQRAFATSQPSEISWRSYYRKKFWLICNQSSLISAVFFFLRHNQFCENYGIVYLVVVAKRVTMLTIRSISLQRVCSVRVYDCHLTLLLPRHTVRRASSLGVDSLLADCRWQRPERLTPLFTRSKFVFCVCSAPIAVAPSCPQAVSKPTKLQQTNQQSITYDR